MTPVPWVSKSCQLYFVSLNRDKVGNTFDRSSTHNWKKVLIICLSRCFKMGHFRIVFFFVFSAVDSKYVHYKFLPLTAFKLRSSGIGSDHSANWATPDGKMLSNHSSKILNLKQSILFFLSSNQKSVATQER